MTIYKHFVLEKKCGNCPLPQMFKSEYRLNPQTINTLKIVNKSHKINIYNITPEGLSMPGIEISTKGSEPRDLAILDLEGFSSRRIRFEYIVFWIRVYLGYWTLRKVLIHSIKSFLRAYPSIYSKVFYYEIYLRKKLIVR